MPPNFPESDWKTLSRLKPSALERLCQRILREAGSIIAHTREDGSHRVYLDLYHHIQRSDKVVSDCFDKWSRSHALDILTNWRAENLLTEEEFSAFSAETCRMVEWFLKRD